MRALLEDSHTRRAGNASNAIDAVQRAWGSRTSKLCLAVVLVFSLVGIGIYHSEALPGLGSSVPSGRKRGSAQLWPHLSALLTHTHSSGGSFKNKQLEADGRLTVDEFLDSPSCRGLREIYMPLIDSSLTPWQEGLTIEEVESTRHDESVTMWFKHGRLYVDGGKGVNSSMVGWWAQYFHGLLQKVKLPSSVLAVNPWDLPFGKLDPWFSFCRHRHGFNDMLLPDLGEDPLFQNASEKQPMRAGPGDGRRPAAIWLGRAMEWEHGKRRAIVKEGLAHPERVHAGLTEWKGLVPEPANPEEMDKYIKPHFPTEKWADEFKYVINVAGTCASIRLAYQLFSDAAVLWVDSDDMEWYYPLLKPYVHYIPVEVRPNGSNNLLAQIEWAEKHPDKVRKIVKASTDFARRHLLPRSGKDCYTVLLLHKYSKLIRDATSITPPPKLLPYQDQ